MTDLSSFPPAKRRLRLGMVGGGRGSLIGPIHAMGARLDNRYEIVAGCMSSKPDVAKASAADWFIADDRAYTRYEEMAAAEAARPDGIDVVAITTPNATHHAIATAFLKAGIDVICDKPLTTTLDDALDLVRTVRESGLVFGVTHAFAAYPMVRHAKEMIAGGEIGRLRLIQVEYVQDWKTEDLSGRPNKQYGWRHDPAVAGPTACTADIGTHAHHLATFVTGTTMTKLRAEMLTAGPPNPMDDTIQMMVRYDETIPGMLWCTQVAPGNGCGLRLRVFGDKAGLEWDQENPEFLQYSRFGAPVQTISRGHGAGVGPAGLRFTRTPRAHPEAMIEAWANLYTELAVAIEARRDGRAVDPALLNFPTVEDGARGMKFIDATMASHAADGAWVDCTLAL